METSSFLANMMDGDDLVMKPIQRQPIQHIPEGDSFGKRMGRKGEDLAMEALTSYATGAGTANPYAAGMMLGARALFGSDGMQVPAQGNMSSVASDIMNSADLMQVENDLISEYENIKRHLYGGGKVKYYQEGTDMAVPYPRPLIGDLNESVPRPDIDQYYGLPDSLNENADILAMTNLPEFVQRAADHRSPALIGEGGEPQAMQTVDYEAGGEQRLAPTIRVDREMNQAYQMGAKDAINAAERANKGKGDYAVVPTDRGYSPKAFSDLISAYVGKLRKDSIDT